MNKLEEDVMSPEGLEERVKQTNTYEITLTQGGKYRGYAIDGNRRTALGISDTFDDAKKKLAMHMGLMASMVVDPKKTLDLVFSMMGKGDQHDPAADSD